MLAATLLAWVALAAPSPVCARVGQPDVNLPDYPDASLVDFSFLVPTPAGKHGFVTTRPDGHFYFADGSRARFWGVNVSSRSINIPDEEIDAACERFRRAGCNMLRLEATDNGGMLLETPVKGTSRNINAAYLRKMHRWMAAAKNNGLYTYLQLLDFRTFQGGDGVENAPALGRAAKPYAIFDPQLIALQKEFARQLLETPNPYTGLKPIQDPAVAVIELMNEHGLFIKGSSWRALAPPYDRQLKAMWNGWLKARYRTDAALKKAWTAAGKSALQAGEALEQGTVELPDMSDMTREDRVKAGEKDPRRAPARLDDGARFAYGVQRKYFREMRSYLRGRGVKVPVTAVVSTWIAPDVKSVADELDFTAENWYWDHPTFEPGKEWKAPFYYSNRDPLSDTGAWNAPPYMAALRWKGKPVVIREWAAVWPNEYRAASVPLAATYAALQDIDGMLAFGYSYTGQGKIGDFNWERDPVRWGLMGLGALLYLRADVKPFSGVAQLAYNDKALFTYQDYLNSLYRLAWVLRLENVTAPPSAKTPAKPAKAVAKLGAKPAAKPAAKPSAKTPAKTSAPTPALVTNVVLSLPAQPADPEAALKSAIARIYSANRNVDDKLSRIGLIQGPQIVALTTSDRFFSVVAPNAAILAGRLSRMSGVYPGFSTGTPYGCLWIATLDGKTLDASDHYILKMVSIARNTGEQFEKSAGPYYPDGFAMKSTGAPPIVTEGAKGERPTVIAFAEGAEGQAPPALKVDMVNGTWEFERDGDIARVYCDTPGISITVPDAVTAVAHLTTGQTQPVTLKDGTFTYPQDAARVELRFG